MKLQTQLEATEAKLAKAVAQRAKLNGKFSLKKREFESVRKCKLPKAEKRARMGELRSELSKLRTKRMAVRGRINTLSLKAKRLGAQASRVTAKMKSRFAKLAGKTVLRHCGKLFSTLIPGLNLFLLVLEIPGLTRGAVVLWEFGFDGFQSMGQPEGEGGLAQLRDEPADAGPSAEPGGVESGDVEGEETDQAQSGDGVVLPEAVSKIAQIVAVVSGAVTFGPEDAVLLSELLPSDMSAAEIALIEQAVAFGRIVAADIDEFIGKIAQMIQAARAGQRPGQAGDARRVGEPGPAQSPAPSLVPKGSEMGAEKTGTTGGINAADKKSSKTSTGAELAANTVRPHKAKAADFRDGNPFVTPVRADAESLAVFDPILVRAIKNHSEAAKYEGALMKASHNGSRVELMDISISSSRHSHNMSTTKEGLYRYTVTYAFNVIDESRLVERSATFVMSAVPGKKGHRTHQLGTMNLGAALRPHLKFSNGRVELKGAPVVDFGEFEADVVGATIAVAPLGTGVVYVHVDLVPAAGRAEGLRVESEGKLVEIVPGQRQTLLVPVRVN